MKTLAWTWFVLAQLVMLVCMVLGFLILPLPCLLRAWEWSPSPSIKDGRRIDRWKWKWLFWANNPEDGVSGLTARVWVNGVTQGAYWPSCPSAALRAYAWSAWRNSCDALKYSLAITGLGTPSVVILGRRIGWSVENGRPVLVV